MKFSPRVILVLVLGTAPWLAQAAPTGLDPHGHLLKAVQAGQDFAYTRLASGVQFVVNGITRNVIFYGPSTVRVNANLGRNYWQAASIVVIDKPAHIKFGIADSGATLSLISPALRIDIDKHSGALTFKNKQGVVYTQEHASTPVSVQSKEIAGAPTYEVENTFALKPNEAIYGLGFIEEGERNRRGKELLLVQTNVGTVIPVMVSSERYGIMWDTYSKMKFKDNANGATLWAEDAPGGVDYYFMGAPSLDGVVAAYRKLTGAAPMYPKQAFGLFMSKERYATQQRVVEVAEAFRKEQFPLDYMVQDWQYWGSDKDGSWSGMIWDKERYPDPAGMTKALHDLHMKLMISIWPSVGNDTPLAQELDQHGLRFAPLHWISKKARIYDAYSPLGRSIYFKHIKRGLLDYGVDALWMDGTEVEVGTACWNPVEVESDIKSLGRNALGDFSRYLNPYSLLTTQGAYDGQRASGNKRVFTLTRSGWAGAQRTAAASWTGDIFASWKTLREQIAGGVNVTVTGNPYWSQDTGGFFVTEYPKGENDPAYRELFARWFQFGAFNPIMRVHGTNIEREPYIFKTLDAPMYKSLRDTVNLRYRLLPYIYSLSWKVTADGYTLMRPLAMDFVDDPAVLNINDAFMFGSSILVHPVTRPMYHVPETPPLTIPASALRTAHGRPGLAGQYFAGEGFETPRGKVVDATIDHQWPGPPLAGPPAGLDSLEHFSARWEGQLIAPEDGEYEIGVEGDDGYRLYLDNAKLIELWEAGPKRYRSAQVTLKKGQSVPLKLEYFQGGQDRNLRLAWRTPSQAQARKASTPARDLTMRTYLPKGRVWYDFWTNQAHQGGQTVDKETPLDVVPLYIPAGAILPLGPQVQYATEHPEAPLEVRIYPGADGKFTLYEDDNETYDYEQGKYATYELAWHDASSTLTIGARKGQFAGLIKQRELRIVLMSPTKPARVVQYKGAPVKVVLRD